MERKNVIAIGVVVLVVVVGGVFLLGNGKSLMGSFSGRGFDAVPQRAPTARGDYNNMRTSQADPDIQSESSARMNVESWNTPTKNFSGELASSKPVNELAVGTEVIAMDVVGWEGMLGYKGKIETVNTNGTYTVKVTDSTYTMKDVKKSDLAIFAKHPQPGSVPKGSAVIYKGPLGDNTIPDEAYVAGKVLSSVGTNAGIMAKVPKDPTDLNSDDMIIDYKDIWVLLSE